MLMYDCYQALIDRFKTSDLSESQPTKGNIEGGLSTIEEKALGNIQKIGKECVVEGVLDKAGRAHRARALVYGLVIRRLRDDNVVCCKWLRCALLSDWTG